MYRLALAQISTSENITQNLAKHLKFIDEAKVKQADMIIFPELSLGGQFAGELATKPPLSDYRNALDSALDMILHASQNIAVVFGVPEFCANGIMYNSAIIHANQKHLLNHQKLNIPTYGKLIEGKYYAAGSKLKKVQLNDDQRSTGAVLICADSWNPALVYLTALQGINLLILPVSSAMNAVDGKMDNPTGWTINTQHSAMTYGMYVVMVNRTGRERDMDFYGQSKVLDPYGNIMIQADSQEQLLIVDIDWDEALTAKTCLPTVRDADPLRINMLLKRHLQS